MTFHAEPLEQVFQPADLIYFSPDAEEEIESIDPTKTYVIGGLVDRSIAKVQKTAYFHNRINHSNVHSNWV